MSGDYREHVAELRLSSVRSARQMPPAPHLVAQVRPGGAENKPFSKTHPRRMPYIHVKVKGTRTAQRESRLDITSSRLCFSASMDAAA